MPLIDNTYFINRINLPQLGSSSVASAVDRYIAKHEPIFMAKALGYGFYKTMKEALLIEPVEQRFELLINGSDYTINGKLDHWGGFVNESKASPIANYVYYHYLHDINENLGSIGAAQNLAENATKVSNITKMVGAWEEMREMMSDMYKYLYANRVLYPEFDICHAERFEPKNVYF